METLLNDLLRKEVENLQLFCTAIAEEQSVLVAAKIDQLKEAADKKAALAAALASLDRQRNELLVANGFEAGRKGMESWLQTQNSSSTTRQYWNRLLELAANAKLENEINGRLIGSQLQQNQQALSILLGDDAKPATYGPDGQQTGSVGRRPLGQA